MKWGYNLVGAVMLVLVSGTVQAQTLPKCPDWWPWPGWLCEKDDSENPDTVELQALYRFESTNSKGRFYNAVTEQYDATSGVLFSQTGQGDGYDQCFGAQVADSSSTSSNRQSSRYRLETGWDLDSDIGTRGTVAFWYRSDLAAFGNKTRVLFDASGGARHFLVGVSPEGRLGLLTQRRRWDGEIEKKTIVSGAAVLVPGQWDHVALTWNQPANLYRLFVNGLLVASGSAAAGYGLPANSPIGFGDLSSNWSNADKPDVFPAAGRFDDIQIYSEILSDREILRSANAEPQRCDALVTNFVINHPASTVTCRPAPVMLSLVDDAQVIVDKDVTVTLSPDYGWQDKSGNAITEVKLSGGLAEVQFQYVPGQADNPVTLGISGESATCVSSKDDSCQLAFTATGYELGIDAPLACGSGQLTITALQAAADPTVCQPLANQQRTVNLSARNDTSQPAGIPLQLGLAEGRTNLLPDVDRFSSPLATKLYFDEWGQARIDKDTPLGIVLQFKDAGQVSLRVEDGDNWDTLRFAEAQERFYSRPARLEISSLAGGECAAADHSCAAFAKADEPFAMRVQAVCDDGTPTPSFQHDSISLDRVLKAPKSSHQGTLDVPQIAITARDTCVIDDEKVRGCKEFQQRISEVGVFDFTVASVDNYLEQPGLNIAGSSTGPIGRFFPAYWLASNLGQGPVASCGSFSYLGQPFSFAGANSALIQFVAKNAAGDTTQNYQGDFIRPFVDDQFPLTDADLFPSTLDGSGNAVVTTQALGDGKIYRSLEMMNLALTKPSQAVAPQTYALELTVPGAVLTDTDGVSFQVQPGNWDLCQVDQVGTDYRLCGLNSGEQRFGRANLLDVYGNETDILPLALQAEYFDGTGFVLNSADNCSENLSQIKQLFPGQPGSGFTPELQHRGLTLSDGLGNLWLTEPDVPGEVELGHSLLSQPWLQYNWFGQGPEAEINATATFGRFRGNDRVIWRREVFN